LPIALCSFLTDKRRGRARAKVPAPAREAILEIVAGLCVHRGDGPEELPLAGQALLSPYRVFNV
jgi:hypothetical protein